MMNQCSFFLFNTANTVSADVDDTVLDEVTRLCARYELTFSRFNPASELYRLNHSTADAVPVSSELADALTAALRYCKATDGLFDITMGSVLKLWNFHTGTMPCESDLAAACEHVNWQSISVEYRASDSADQPPATWVRRTDSKTVIDLGGIAKGYIADRIIDLLRSRGAAHALVNLGGNVAVMGGKENRVPWKIGLRRPVSTSDASLNERPAATQILNAVRPFAAVSLRNGSAVTSGTYERAFVKDGRLYHHILDPKTGMPAETDLQSVSVISERSIDGDGYTTALIAMGAQRALSFCEVLPGIEAVGVTTAGEIVKTSGIGTKVPFEQLA